jgi:hypothetical protein
MQNYRNAYPSNQRVDLVPKSLHQINQPVYDSYGNNQVFGEAVDQLMQPIPMTPTNQSFGPFFGQSMPIVEQPVGEIPIGSFDQMIRGQQEASRRTTEMPDTQSDFWFFPQ